MVFQFIQSVKLHRLVGVLVQDAEDTMGEIAHHVNAFFLHSASESVSFFNEAELQHELGFWLRIKLPTGSHVYFERPAHHFFESARGLVKKEIDLVVSPPDRSWCYAIELKCPRSGRIPETLFDAIRDIKMLEQLTSAGFVGGLFVMHVNDEGFYKKRIQTSIYSPFRAGQLIKGQYIKPTGARDEVISLTGEYSVKWQSFGSAEQYWVQQVDSTRL